MRPYVGGEPFLERIALKDLRSGLVITPTSNIGDHHVGVQLTWSETNFAEFAFDLLAMMRGAYDGRRSSYHGYDFSEWIQPRIS